MKQTLEQAAIEAAEDCYEMPYDENFINMKLIKDAFMNLIDEVSGKGTWNIDPYVWVYEFELID